MRTALKVVGWLGLALMAVGAVPSYTSSLTLVRTGTLGSGAGYFLTFLVGLLSAAMIVGGAFGGRHKTFGLAAIVVGIAYVSTFFGYAFMLELRMVGGLALVLLPGLVSVGAGIRILTSRRRERGMPKETHEISPREAERGHRRGGC